MMAIDTPEESHVEQGETIATTRSKTHVFASSSRDVVVENYVSAVGGGKVRDCLAAQCSAIDSLNHVCDGTQTSDQIIDGEDAYSASGSSAPPCVPGVSEVPPAPGASHGAVPGAVDGAAGASYCLKDAASRSSSAGTKVLLQCRRHAERVLLAMNKQRATGTGTAGVNCVNGPCSALCDVTLCAGGTRFPAHRAILAACSEYFQTMFASESWGHPGGPWVYIVEGADGGVLAAVLDFVYTGQLCLEQSLVGQAAGMAQVLKMPELLSACAEYQAKRRVAVASNGTSVLVVDRPSTSPSKQSVRLRGRPRRMSLHQQETLQADLVQRGGEKHPAGESSADVEFTTCSLEGEQVESEKRSPTDEQDESKTVRRSRHSNRRIRQPARLTVYSLTREAEDEDPRVGAAGSTPCVTNNSGSGGSTDVRCSYCGKVFKNQHFYRVHLRTHTGERPFRCSRCGRGFSQKHSLQVHSQVHTGEQPFQCTLCAKALSTKHSLSEHMSLHTGQKTFSCEQCGRLFSQKRQLRSHQRVHTGHLRECSQCARKFSDTAQLKKHMRTHTGEKPFRCEVCGKCFTANGTLTTHLRIHRGEKPYSCSDCGRAFSDPSARRRHAALHKGVRPHSCPVCPQRFARPDNLRSHMKIHAHLQELDKEGLARASQKSESRNHMGIDVEALSTKHGDGESNSIFQYQVTSGGTGIRLLLSGGCSPVLDSLGGNQSLHVLQPTIPLPSAPVLEVGGGALLAGRSEAVGTQLTLMGEGSTIPLGSVNELALVTDDTMLTISGPPNGTSSGIQVITLNADEYQQLPQGAGCESREFSGEGEGSNVDSHALMDPAFQLQAGSDGKTIGCCPSSQRLFMILLLKKIHFKVTAVDVHRKSANLANLAPGTQPPFLTFNGGVKTDTLKIEEFLEDILCPPRYPELAVQYPGSNSAGRDIFSRFSACIRNTNLESNAALERTLMHTLEILDLYLMTPLPGEPGEGPSKRSFLDGNHLTLADCTLLPKLHVIRVVLGRYRGLHILERFSGIQRYMQHAIAQNEFSHSCPTEQEIERAYFTIAQSLK